MFDSESDYCKRIEDVVLLYNTNTAKTDPMAEKVVKQTIDAIQSRAPGVRCQIKKLVIADPTDHVHIFDFLKQEIPKIRQEFAERELVVHISPGTPAMQTVWVLMAECGFIEPPFIVVKSYREGERKRNKAVLPVGLGIETYYKVFQSSRPRRVSISEEGVMWDPSRFRSKRLIELYSEARSFAKLRVPVLILGERGTGKTTLASWMRANSDYCRPALNDNWASIPCGQYTPKTMRSELFGYVKGAFTGAEREHDGVLKVADGDTLFLDEVGDISRDLQRLLIRAVEEGVYNRLGSTKVEKSTFRLISATNISDSELRERLDPDFYDRIGGLRVTIPPLRQIPEDLPWLWMSAFETALRRSGLKSPVILIAKQHAEIAERLTEHRLPGNMRDLLKVANRLIAKLSDEFEGQWREALSYAVSTLDTTVGISEHSRSIAEAFANGQRLDPILKTLGAIQTKQLEQDLKDYLASELRRIASMSGVDPSDLCDVSGRTLRDWSSRGALSRTP